MWQEWAFFALSPFSLAMAGGLAAGVSFAFRRRKLAKWLACLSFAGLWLASTPAAAVLLLSMLQGPYRAMSPADAPTADAILVLGGAVIPADPPARPTFVLGPSSMRVWHAAALYRAGKAKWVVISAGNRPSAARLEPESEAIAKMLEELKVPREAIRQESASRNTRENAAMVKPVLESLGARRILLCTSGDHMLRAVKTLNLVWADPRFEIIPAVTESWSPNPNWWAPGMWLPSLNALVTVTKSLKELAGIAALAIIRDTG